MTPTYKQIILTADAVLGYREEKPAYYPYDSLTTDWAKPSFEEHEQAAKDRFNEWQSSAERLEWGSSEEVYKLRMALPFHVNLPFDITNLVYLKEACDNAPWCSVLKECQCNHKLYFKSPSVVEETQRLYTEEEMRNCFIAGINTLSIYRSKARMNKDGVFENYIKSIK